jgi:hypothetical protein
MDGAARKWFTEIRTREPRGPSKTYDYERREYISTQGTGRDRTPPEGYIFLHTRRALTVTRGPAGCVTVFA